MVKPLFVAVLVPLALLLLAPMALAQSYTFFMEPGDRFVELEVKHPDMSVHRIYFNITGQDDRYSVRIVKLDSDLEWVHDRFVVITKGIVYPPEDIVIDLKVSKSWIEGENVDLSTVGLLVHDGLWKRFDPIPYAEDSDFMFYRSESPILNTTFGVTGEPVPVEIDVSSPCNGNDVCEPELGEDRENCPDCVILAQTICVPYDKYCSGDSLLECNDDGSDYSLEPCVFGCANDACLLSAPSPIAGMAVAQDPLFITIVAVMLAVILLLTFLVKRMRNELLKVDQRRESHEDVKKLVKS
jgi:hypothetical protein